MPFDSLVANPGRLRILTALAAEPRPFVQLRRQTGLTDGNLSTHARRLQSAGLVTIEKIFEKGKPTTTLHLTRAGRDALTSHVQALQDALQPTSSTITAPAIEEEPSDWVD